MNVELKKPRRRVPDPDFVALRSHLEDLLRDTLTASGPIGTADLARRLAPRANKEQYRKVCGALIEIARGGSVFAVKTKRVRAHGRFCNPYLWRVPTDAR